MEVIDGWLTPGQKIASDNCDLRPNADISMIVIHCISLPAGHFGNDYVEQLFTNCLDVNAHADFVDLEGLHVASHLFVRRDGEVLQFVPFDRRAWHAGVSEYQGRAQCNDFSIGIELEGTDDGAYSPIQYQKLVAICRLLLDNYGIPAAHIVGHSDIAPGRKTDPGTKFDWSRLRAGVTEVRP